MENTARKSVTPYNHVQFSVFLCEINERELIALKEALTGILNHREDQVLVIRLGPADADISTRIECLGQAFQPPARVVVV